MVPKVLCSTFNHYWGKTTTVKRLVSRPISAEFTGEVKGRHAKLLVIAERVEIITKTCTGCGSVEKRIVKEDQIPHTLSLAIDRRNVAIHTVDPLSLICPTCSTILRPANIGHAPSCYHCTPIKLPTRIPPPNPAGSEDFDLLYNKQKKERENVNMRTKP